MYFLVKLNYINSFFAKVIHDYSFCTFIEFFAPWKRIMDAKKYYLDLIKKLLKNRDKTPQFLEVCRRVAAPKNLPDIY